TGRSAVWLARLAWDQEVSGSNPLAPIAANAANIKRSLEFREYGLLRLSSHRSQAVDGQLHCDGEEEAYADHTVHREECLVDSAQVRWLDDEVLVHEQQRDAACADKVRQPQERASKVENEQEGNGYQVQG